MKAGILPQEMQIRREVSDLRQLLEGVHKEEGARYLAREINGKILEDNLQGRFSIGSGMDQICLGRVLEKVGSERLCCLLEEKPSRKEKTERANPGTRKSQGDRKKFFRKDGLTPRE